MRKIAAVLVFALVTVLTGSAYATTLTVEEGRITLWGMDRGFNFSGDGFSVFLVSPSGANISLVMGVEGSASITTFFDVPGSAFVSVGQSACTQFSFPDPKQMNCGAITLTSPGLPIPPLGGVTESVAFTATGHFNVGDGYDFVGQGTVNATFDPNFGFGPALQYTFSVAEPPTLLLVVASFGALGVLFSARVLRDRRYRLTK
jgi:hypothetical protein